MTRPSGLASEMLRPPLRSREPSLPRSKKDPDMHNMSNRPYTSQLLVPGKTLRHEVDFKQVQINLI